MRDGMERRAFEFRASEDGKAIDGVVIPYGQNAIIREEFTERFVPGSVIFSDVIANRQHDRQRPLARTNGGGAYPDRYGIRASGEDRASRHCGRSGR